MFCKKLIAASLVITSISLTCGTAKAEGIGKSDIGGLVGAFSGAWIGSNVGKGKGKIAAIAAGTLLGAAIGNNVGRSLDRADGRYHNNNYGRPWNNPDYYQQPYQTNYGYAPATNYGYTNVTYVRTYEQPATETRYCREFTQTISVGGSKRQGYGTACMQPDGSWEVVHQAE